MSMPPKNISGAELWAKITQTPREHEIVPFPRLVEGEQVDVAMIVLTQEESFLANLECEKYIRKMMKEDLPKNGEISEGYNRMYELRASVEILSRAVRDAHDVSKAFFKTKDEISRTLTTDEIGTLMREYHAVRAKIGPAVLTMSEGEVDAWIERLGEAEDAFPLVFLDSAALSQLVMSMVYRLYKSPTEKTSAGESPNEPSAHE